MDKKVKGRSRQKLFRRAENGEGGGVLGIEKNEERRPSHEVSEKEC